ncbi:MAG: hypothetical protein MUF66_07385 [Gammaproteobacteria bacterium]|nr:hypothetical protein [Gammaproteobacteria bacterium]
MDWEPYARQVLTTLGQSATYRTGAQSIPVTALVRRGLQLEPEGFQGQAAARQIRVELLVAEIGDVAAIRRGETIEVDETCYVVERVEADNGVVVSLFCYEAVTP